MGCHRNTVRNIVKREQPIEKQTREKASGFAIYETQIAEWKKAKLSRLRIYEKLQETYAITLRYDALCKYMQKAFPKEVEAFGVQQVDPGEVMEIDFGELCIIVLPDGKRMKIYGIAVVLGYSRVGYYGVCLDQKLETLCKHLEKAFAYFGGVPKRAKVDNMKTAILKNQHYDLEFNQTFLEFALHHKFVILPCEPYHPEQKGKVESGIKYMQNNFVAGRAFSDDKDMEKQLESWMQDKANQRMHGTTRKVPWHVLLEEERSCLQPVPQEPFAFFNRGIRTVAPNCHIHFENNYYSVPSAFVRKNVTVRWNDHILRVIYEGEQIALHQRDKGQGNHVTVRSHMPENKVYSQTEYQQKYETKMQALGREAHEYFTMLLTTKESYWFRSVRSILGLAETYGKEAVNATLKRAMYYNALDLTTIKNILEQKLYQLELEPVLLTNHEQQTVTNTYSRDLSYYQSQMFL